MKVLLVLLDGMRPDAARGLCDTVKAKYADAVAVFAVVDGDKLNFVACAGSEAVKSGDVGDIDAIFDIFKR